MQSIIPTDLIPIILSYADFPTLVSCLSVSRVFFHFASRGIYSNGLSLTQNHYDRNPCSSMSFLESLRRANYSKFVKSVTIRLTLSPDELRDCINAVMNALLNLSNVKHIDIRISMNAENSTIAYYGYGSVNKLASCIFSILNSSAHHIEAVAIGPVLKRQFFGSPEVGIHYSIKSLLLEGDFGSINEIDIAEVMWLVEVFPHLENLELIHSGDELGTITGEAFERLLVWSSLKSLNFQSFHPFFDDTDPSIHSLTIKRFGYTFDFKLLLPRRNMYSKILNHFQLLESLMLCLVHKQSMPRIAYVMQNLVSLSLYLNDFVHFRFIANAIGNPSCRLETLKLQSPTSLQMYLQLLSEERSLDSLKEIELVKVNSRRRVLTKFLKIVPSLRRLTIRDTTIASASIADFLRFNSHVEELKIEQVYTSMDSFFTDFYLKLFNPLAGEGVKMVRKFKQYRIPTVIISKGCIVDTKLVLNNLQLHKNLIIVDNDGDNWVFNGRLLTGLVR
ncbi:hypothetical protein BKA69DRAFT_1040376 [Paraphysoderma sedebokerense]|nr:hypothetical protein BKA69DRAFT_1040376 [Paraphysoderma sedebokerense]